MKEYEDDLKLLEEVLQDYAKTINRIIILGDNNERIR